MNLVERLRAGQPYDSILRDEVANRIEQLEREKAELVEALDFIAITSVDDSSERTAREALAKVRWK